MDNIEDEFSSNENPTDSPQPIYPRTIPGIVKWLVGFFSFSDEEQMASGIDMSSEKSEW